MSKNLNESLSEILDVEPIEYEIADTQKEIVAEVVTDAVEDDSEFARKNIRELIAKGNTAIDELLVVAKATDHPRAYEVVSGLIKNISDLNKDLLEIHRKKKDLAPAKTEKGVNIDKAVFVGSTTELIRMLKGKGN